MAGTPQGTPPEIRDEMDMSWEFTGPAVNTTTPSQFLQDINNPLAADDIHPTLQPAESFDDDAVNAHIVTAYNPQWGVLPPGRGRLFRTIPRTAAQHNQYIGAHNRRGRTGFDRVAANIATSRRLGPRVNTNAQSRSLRNANNWGVRLLFGDLSRPHHGSSRSQPRQRPGTIPTPIRHIANDTRLYIHGLCQPRQRLNVNAPSFRNVADNNLPTSPLLQSIQRESLTRSQSPLQDRVVLSPKRKQSDEPPSDGRSEDKLFHGENYYSIIRAVQTTEEGKRCLVSPKDEERLAVSPPRSPTNRRSSSFYSIFYQDLTRAPGHRPVTPVTPPKFRGNGRSMPGTWPESPVTPLSLDTSTISTNLITPPSTPDMSKMPGAWPKSPEPLPVTTIGSAAITPPESPVDGSPTVNMDNVPASISEPSAREHSYGSTSEDLREYPVVWPEGPEEYQCRNLDQRTKDMILLFEKIQKTDWYVQQQNEQREARRARRVQFPDNPVTRVRRYSIGEPISYPSPASTGGSHDETSLLSLSPSVQLHQDSVGSASSSSPPSSPSFDDEAAGSDDEAPGFDDGFPGSDDGFPGSDDGFPGSDDGSPPPSLGPTTATDLSPIPTEHHLTPIEPSPIPIEHSPTPIEHSPTPTEHSLMPTEHSSTPTKVPSAPVEVPFTPFQDLDDAISAQLGQELEYFLLRSDRRKAHREVEQAETKKTRQAQAAEQAAEEARQAEAEEARQKAESDARKKIEEDEECKKSGRRRLPTESVLEPLTAEWEAKLLDILGKRANEVVAMTSAGNELDRRDIGKVLPQPGTTDDASGWLNDNVINGYLDSIVDYGLKARGHRRGETPKLHAFNSAFYNNITERGVESVKRWSRRPKISGKDLLKVEHVFIPVNVGGAHWTLLVVSPTWKRIEYFDSLHGSSGAAIRNAKAWIKMELGDAWVEDEWEVVEDPALRGRGKGPLQSNSSDCGVFTITTAKMISLGVDPMAITAGDMPLQRKRVVVELVNGGFSGEFEPHVVF